MAQKKAGKSSHPLLCVIPELQGRVNTVAEQLKIPATDLVQYWLEERLEAEERKFQVLASSHSSSIPTSDPINPHGTGILRTLLARSEVIEKESLILGYQMRGMGADLVDLGFALNEKVETLKAGLAVFAKYLLQEQVSLSSAAPMTGEEIDELIQTLFPVEPLAVTVQERPQ